MAPETSMEIQAALGSDLALVFDECTPFNVEREYTARSTERTHRWLRRCLDWHHEHGPEGQLVYGIVQGGVYEDLRVESAQAIAASECDGIAIGGSLGADKPEMYQVVEWTTAVLPEDRPRHLLGIGEIDDLVRGVELGIDTFDCAMPTRLGRHGMVLVPDPGAPLARRPHEVALEGLRRAADGGLPVPGLRAGPDPRLPALPGPRPRADRPAPVHAAQPRVRRARHAPAARRDRRGAPRGGGRPSATAARRSAALAGCAAFNCLIEGTECARAPAPRSSSRELRWDYYRFPVAIPRSSRTSPSGVGGSYSVLSLTSCLTASTPWLTSS